MTPLAPHDVQARLEPLDGWAFEAGPPARIARTFAFGSYAEGVAFGVRVAMLAERTDHHPDLEIRHRSVRVAYSSHDAGGVTERDLRAAASVAAL